MTTAYPIPILVAPLSPAFKRSDAVSAVQDRPATYSELAAIPLPYGRTLFRFSSSRATSFPRVARIHSRILAQQSFAPTRAEARLGRSSLNLVGLPSGFPALFGACGNSVGALLLRTFKTNPSRTHRDAEPRLTNSEAL
jgi:hypothetical protein